jgi:hypothetical protein
LKKHLISLCREGGKKERKTSVETSLIALPSYRQRKNGDGSYYPGDWISTMLILDFKRHLISIMPGRREAGKKNIS